jgi:hypothetical protein
VIRKMQSIFFNTLSKESTNNKNLSFNQLGMRDFFLIALIHRQCLGQIHLEIGVEAARDAQRFREFPLRSGTVESSPPSR